MEISTLRARTPTLRIAYEQTGSLDGQAILLLHGFPYDVRQFDALREDARLRGARVIAPYLRGYGGTRYLFEKTMRSGQQAVLGKDVVDLMDALQIDKALLVGYDWGGRAACVVAALWPERVLGLVSSGYQIQDIAQAAVTPHSAEQEHQLWYQWYFQTERGRLGLAQNRREISKLLWQMWSPGWQFSDAEFGQTAGSFDNPDFVETVIHSYRHRYGNVAGDPAFEELERRLAEKPKITVPAVTIRGTDDRVEPAAGTDSEASLFTSYYERRVLAGVGHCIPAEAPDEVALAIEEILRRS